ARTPTPPHCFSRTLHDLSCFWDQPGDPDPRRYRLQYRLEQDPWQECPSAPPRWAGRGSRFWCSLPPAATVTFVPLELRVLPAAPPGTPPGTPPKTSETTGTPPPAGVVALSVIFGGLGALALLALLLLAALRLREKRRTEGSYRPSREEMGGGARGAPPGPPPLRLPPEERLI
ncbi:unnamed protein product, partial [Coccothraustes coccothraustes]